MSSLFARFTRLALAAGLVLSTALAPVQAREARYYEPTETVGVAQLPQEARTTLSLIVRGGPFPFRRDGIEFHNRENRLPPQPRGYYHEYTVPTPGAYDRGARRIIAGGEPPQVFYYTADHYRSFQRIRP